MCLPSSVHIWEKFLSSAVINSVPSVKRLAKSLSAPQNAGFLKVNFSLVSYHKKRGLEIVWKCGQTLWLYVPTMGDEEEKGDRELCSQFS